MTVAALLAGLSAVLGGALAIAARRRRVLLELTRTFAFAAAAGVVAFHLLPELLPALGPAALVWIAAGFALPWLLEISARKLGPGVLRARGMTGARVAAEIGFIALVFHSVVEGLALVAALQAPRGKLDLEIALIAHHAPLTAAVALPFLELRGARMAAVRVLGIALAGVFGVILSRALPGLQTDSLMIQRATAVTAGALLHVVADEIRAQQPGSRLERAGDLLACLAGLSIAGFSAVLHLRDSPAAAPVLAFVHAFAAMALSAAPMLLAGAALRRVFPRLPPLDAPLVALALLGPVAGGALLPAALLADIRPFRERAPRLLAVLIVAATVEALAPLATGQGALLATGQGALLAALLIAIALGAQLEDAAAVVIAAAAVHKGLPLSLALAALAAAGIARAVRHHLPLRRIALAGAAALALSGAAIWLRADPVALLADARAGLPCAAALAALSLATLWDTGVRGFFVPLRHSAGEL